MANKRRILTVTLLIAVLGVVSWLILSQPSEPVYQRKPLSYWCAQYASNSFQGSDKEMEKHAEIAIQEIGANGVPTLLRMLNAKDSKLKFKLFQLASKQHIITIKWKSAGLLHYEANQALRALGTNAQSAVPGLIEIYNQLPQDVYNNPWDITFLFASMGPAAADAVPFLVRDTTSTNADLRSMAVRSLGYLHIRSELAVPALITSLRDPDANVRTYTASSLAAFGNDAQSIVPELVKALADPSPAVRGNAAWALKKIDPEAAAKAGAK